MHRQHQYLSVHLHLKTHCRIVSPSYWVPGMSQHLPYHSGRKFNERSGIHIISNDPYISAHFGTPHAQNRARRKVVTVSRQHRGQNAASTTLVAADILVHRTSKFLVYIRLSVGGGGGGVRAVVADCTGIIYRGTWYHTIRVISSKGTFSCEFERRSGRQFNIIGSTIANICTLGGMGSCILVGRMKKSPKGSKGGGVLMIGV